MNNKNSPRKTARPSDGLLRQNVILMSGLLISPVIAGATTFGNAMILSLGFALITIPTIMLCRFVPRKIVYTIRIIVYAIVASTIYIPVMLLLERAFSLGGGVEIYVAVLVTNPVILSKTETRLYLRSYGAMVLEIFGYTAGFILPCLVIGALRDIFVNSAIGWLSVDTGLNIPALETTFGGFILVGVLAGLFRALYSSITKKREENKT